MNRTHLVVRLIAASAVLMAAAHGCGSALEEEGTDEPQVLSPLQVALGLSTSITHEEVEDRIVQCMKAQGFTYLARQRPPTEQTYRYTSEEVSEVGFGISTNALQQADLPDGLRGYDTGAENEDPNALIVDELGESERAAYFAALHGSSGSEASESTGGGPAVQPDEVGCLQQASPGGAASLAFYDLFQAELAELDERIAASPELAQLEDALAECVREGGFTFTTVDDTLGDFTEASNELIERYRTAAAEDRDKIFADLATLQASEIQLAEAVEECGTRPEINYWSRRDAIEEQYQADFVQRHKDDIQAVRAEWNVGP